jgi:hypothetical protein
MPSTHWKMGFYFSCSDVEKVALSQGVEVLEEEYG